MSTPTIKGLYTSIFNAYDNKKYLKVINRFNKYIEIEHAGLTANLLYMYARSLFNEKKHKEALDAYRILKEWYPNKPVYFEIGLCAIHLGDTDKALEYFKKDLVETPKRIHTHYMLGKCYMQKGDYKNALIHFETMIMMEPESIFSAKAKSSISAIKNHLIHGSFMDTDYNTYLKEGGEISPGLVVYITEYLEKHDRPFIIWDIEEDKIVGIPLIDYDGTGEPIPHIYRNLPRPRMLDHIVLYFEEKDIMKVVEQVSIGDLETLLDDAYLRGTTKDGDISPRERIFINKYESAKTKML